jgi:peroxiredoxin
MKNAIIVSALCTGLVCAAPAERHAVAWYPDGTGLEIYSESTGANRPIAAGEIQIGPGVQAPQDMVSHVVIDGTNTVVFAYGVEASRGPETGTVTIRILPISAGSKASILMDGEKPGRPKVPGSNVPTVAAVREFRAVKVGEMVTLDILQNPSTGEKIYDVLRPIADRPPAPGGMMVTSVLAGTFAPTAPPALRAAPDFTVVEPSGAKTAVASCRGSVVVLNFAFTTCRHCQEEAKILTKLYWEMSGQGLKVLSVAVNPNAAAQVPAFVQQLGIPYPMGYATMDAAMSFMGFGPMERMVVPQIAVIDRNGMIRAQTPAHGDPNLQDEVFLRHLLGQLLAER